MKSKGEARVSIYQRDHPPRTLTVVLIPVAKSLCKGFFFQGNVVQHGGKEQHQKPQQPQVALKEDRYPEDGHAGARIARVPEQAVRKKVTDSVNKCPGSIATPVPEKRDRHNK